VRYVQRVSLWSTNTDAQILCLSTGICPCLES
jgi:hypothetical protein